VKDEAKVRERKRRYNLRMQIRFVKPPGSTVSADETSDATHDGADRAGSLAGFA
jgi:hypothetical protein